MLNKGKVKTIFGNSSRKKLINFLNLKKKNILIVCSKNGKKKILNDKKLNFLNNFNLFFFDKVKNNPDVENLKKISFKKKN